MQDKCGDTKKCVTLKELGSDKKDKCEGTNKCVTLMEKCSDKKFTCDLCDQKSNSVAYSRCLDCEENLCQSCCLAHERSKATRHHKISDLGTLDPETKGKIRQRTFCDKHPEEEIKLVCQKCDVVMCVLCKAVDHDTHKSKTVADKAAELKRSLEAELRQCDDTLRRLSLAAREHEEFDKIINDAERREIEAIEKQYSKLLTVFEAEVIRIKRKIQTVYMERRQSKEHNAASIQSESMRYVSAKNNLQKLVNQGTSVDILKNGPAFIHDKTELTIPKIDNKMTEIFSPAEVEPEGIVAFLLGCVPEQRMIVELENVQMGWGQKNNRLGYIQQIDSASRGGSRTFFQPREDLLQVLQRFDFSRNACIKGLYYTGICNAELAAEWITENQKHRDLDRPFEDPHQCGNCGNKKEAALVCVTCKSSKVELLRVGPLRNTDVKLRRLGNSQAYN